MLYELSAILKSVIVQNKHYISIIVMIFFCSVLLLYSALHTFVSPLSSCLIKALTVAARAVIHVIAKDNPMISQWCLQPGTMLYLTISQMDQFICVKPEMVPQNRETDLVPERTDTPAR